MGSGKAKSLNYKANVYILGSSLIKLLPGPEKEVSSVLVITKLSWSIVEGGWGEGRVHKRAGQHGSSGAREYLLPGTVVTISALGRFIKAFDFTGPYQTRTPSIQGGFQAAGIVVSLLMAFAGGAIVGKPEGSTERGGLSQPAAETEASMRSCPWPGGSSRGDGTEGCVPGLRLPPWVDHPHAACIPRGPLPTALPASFQGAS